MEDQEKVYLQTKYGTYYNLTRTDNKGQECRIEDHLNIINSPYLRELFLKIISKFEPSTKYLHPVHSVSTAFFRIFWKDANGDFRRCLGITTRKKYIQLNVAMNDIPNYSYIQNFSKTYFENIGMDIKMKDRRLPSKNMYTISTINDTDSIHILNNEFESQILQFIDDYLKIIETYAK